MARTDQNNVLGTSCSIIHFSYCAVHFTACGLNFSFVRQIISTFKSDFKDPTTVIISSVSGLKLKPVLTKIEQRAQTHFPLPASWTLTLALRLNPMPGRLMAGETQRAFSHTITNVHTPTSLTICCLPSQEAFRANAPQCCQGRIQWCQEI